MGLGEFGGGGLEILRFRLRKVRSSVSEARLCSLLAAWFSNLSGFVQIIWSILFMCRVSDGYLDWYVWFVPLACLSASRRV